MDEELAHALPRPCRAVAVRKDALDFEDLAVRVATRGSAVILHVDDVAVLRAVRWMTILEALIHSVCVCVCVCVCLCV